MNFVIKGQISRGEPSCLGPSGLSVRCDEPSGNLATNNENPFASPKLRAMGSGWGVPLCPFFPCQIPSCPWDVSNAISFPSVSFLLPDSLGLNSSIW